MGNPDLKHVLGRLAKSPGYLAISVALLALGVGMSTSEFSMANYVLLRPLPFQGGASLLRLFKTSTESVSGPFSPGEYLYLKSSVADFSSVASYNEGSLNIGEPGKAPEVQPGLFVSANFLSTLGAMPYLGSDFAPDACEPGKGNVVLIKKSYWESRFGADPAIIGRTLRIAGENLVVVGIM